MLTRLAVGLLWLLHFLPLPLLAAIGAGVGTAAYHLVASRRRICLRNLELCFPDLDERARRALAREHFRWLGRSYVERGLLWWGSEARLRRLIRVEGLEHITGAGRAVIILAPHFLGLDAAGTRLNMEVDAVSMYSRQSNAYINDLLVKFRSRFRPVRLVVRQEGLRPVIRAIREGRHFYYLPDMDFGPRDSIFVPFFGVPAATVPALPRLAAMTGAPVVPVCTRMLPGGAGYVVRIDAPLAGFPTDDLAGDTRRMNAWIEDRAREPGMLAQYHWTHRRFKTRPPGEPSLYA
jgi:Kdo2-lipid IVA lauroyltransferase/acyltransferase